MKIRKEHDDTADTPEYLRGWAEALIATAGKRKARIALAGYQALVANKSLDKADRDIARKRAEALERIL
jgi:hypothetical protein